MNRELIILKLEEVTGCVIQHDGWCCPTCFFNIDKKLNNEDWQAILLLRGDYDEEDLNNLPKDLDKSYNKILSILRDKQ